MSEEFNTPRDVKEIFRNISPGFQNYLVIAQRFSKTQKHFYVGVEHLFAAFLSESKSLIRKVLADEKTNWKKRVQEFLIKAYNPQKKQQIWEGYLVTPRVQRLWHEAIQSTRFKDTAEVNEGHVLLQFLNDQDCFPYRWLETEAYNVDDLIRKITKEAFPDEAGADVEEEEAPPVETKKGKKPPKEVKDIKEVKEDKKASPPPKIPELQKTISISELFKRDDEMQASMEDTIRLKADFLKEMTAQRKAKAEAKEEFIQIGSSKVSTRYLQEKGLGAAALAKMKEIADRSGKFPDMIMFESKEIAFDELLEMGLDDTSFCEILEMSEEHFDDSLSRPQQTKFLEEEAPLPVDEEAFGPPLLPPTSEPPEEPYGPPALPSAMQPAPASEPSGEASRKLYGYQEREESPYGYKTKELSTGMLKEVSDDFLLDNIDVGDVATRLRKEKDPPPPARLGPPTPQSLFGAQPDTFSPVPQAPAQSKKYDPFGILQDADEQSNSFPDQLTFGQPAPAQAMGFPDEEPPASQEQYGAPVGGFLPSQADPFGLLSKEKEVAPTKSEPIRPFGRIMEPTGSQVEQIKPFAHTREPAPPAPEQRRYPGAPSQEPFFPGAEQVKPVGRPAEGAYPLFEPTKPVGRSPETPHHPFEAPRPASMSTEPSFPPSGPSKARERSPAPFSQPKDPAWPVSRAPEQPSLAPESAKSLAWDVEPVFGSTDLPAPASADPGPVFPKAEPMRPIEKRPEAPPAFAGPELPPELKKTAAEAVQSPPQAARSPQKIEVLPEPLAPSESSDDLINFDETAPFWMHGLKKRVSLSDFRSSMISQEKIFEPPPGEIEEIKFGEKKPIVKMEPLEEPPPVAIADESPHKFVAADATTRELAPLHDRARISTPPQASHVMAPEVVASQKVQPPSAKAPEKPPPAKQPRAKPASAQNLLEDYLPEFPAEGGSDGIKTDALEIPPVSFDDGEQDELLAMFPDDSFGEKEKAPPAAHPRESQRQMESARHAEKDEEHPVDGLLTNILLKMIPDTYPGDLWEPTEADEVCKGIVTCRSVASLVSRSPLKSRKILKYLLSELKHRKDPSLHAGTGIFFFDIERVKSISYEKVVASMTKIKEYLQRRKGAILVALEIGFLIQHTGLRKLTEELFTILLSHGVRCICSMNPREYDSAIASREEAKKLYFPFSVKDVTMLQARSFLKTAAPTLEKEMEVTIEPELLEQAAEIAYKHLESAVFPEALIVAFRKASHVKKEEFGDIGFDIVESINKKDFIYIVSDSSFL
jgi:hypothetical protein